MHTFQINSHINADGILSIKLPEEWAQKEVRVLPVSEFPNSPKEILQENLTVAFDLLTQMSEDFASRQDDLPQTHEEWL